MRGFDAVLRVQADAIHAPDARDASHDCLPWRLTCNLTRMAARAA